MGTAGEFKGATVEFMGTTGEFMGTAGEFKGALGLAPANCEPWVITWLNTK